MCKEDQVSLVDKNFLKLYPKCWTCFNIDWQQKKITTEEFEKMEETAFNETMN